MYYPPDPSLRSCSMVLGFSGCLGNILPQHSKATPAIYLLGASMGSITKVITLIKWWNITVYLGYQYCLDYSRRRCELIN